MSAFEVLNTISLPVMPVSFSTYSFVISPVIPLQRSSILSASLIEPSLKTAISFIASKEIFISSVRAISANLPDIWWLEILRKSNR